VIVVDASAFAEVLLRMPMASAVEARLFGRGESLHAPHLVDIEVAHVLRRYALMGFINL
jgi:predicted nucleic acid-binding protein